MKYRLFYPGSFFTALRKWLYAYGRTSSLFSGMIASLALPPVGMWPIAVMAFSTLFLLLGNQGPRESFWRGWFFGLGYFATGLYWVSFSLGVEIERFFWLIPLSVLGLPSILAIYSGVCCALFSLVQGKVWIRWLAFGLLWAAFEWLRGTLLTGFPWNIPAYFWMKNPAILQLVSLSGAWGLSLWTILWLTAPVLLKDKKHVLFLCVVSSWVAGWAWGHHRLHMASSAHVESVVLRIVQPAISQKMKWAPEAITRNMGIALELSQRPPIDPDLGNPTHIIWPEAAVPFFVEHDPSLRNLIASVIPGKGALIMGAPRYLGHRNGKPVLTNGIVVLNQRGEVEATYDKFHLVPFGEYIPLRQFFPGVVKKITAGDVDYTPGKGPRNLAAPNIPSFSPLVCYEVIFPGKVVDRQGKRPSWLLNLTNDAWFGNTSGPRQHLAISQVRAIEEGLPLVRVANSGISAVIDPWGRIVQSLDLNERGIIDTFLPKPLEQATFFARFGNILFLFMMVAGSVVFLAGTLWRFSVRRRDINQLLE